MPHTNGDVGSPNGDKSRNGTGEATTKKEKRSCLQRFSEFIIDGLENSYARLGLMIGHYPVRFMVGCVIVSCICGIGMVEFHEETKPQKLWVPDGAKVVDDADWIDDNFPSTVFREQILATAGNILQASKIQALMDIYQRTENLQTSSGIMLSDVCVRAGPNCIIKSILDVWAYNDTQIRALTDAQVLIDVKTTTVSTLYGTPIDLDAYLSRMERDSNGDVISAKATLMTWQTQGEDSIKSRTESWENKFISMGKKGHSDLSNVYVFAGRSAEDESQNALQNDLAFLSIGYLLVIVFVYSVMGNYNFLEQRAWVTLGGFVCIGLSLVVAVGLSSAFQQDYGPLQSVLPFLLLGIGVDDMFVIVGALNNLTPEEKASEIPELMSKVLSHAGVSITVTSLTDFVAFIIGATTIIPGLRSFCVYAAIGILALFALQVVFFTACLSIDLRRMRANRDACLCCIKHREDYQPNECSQKQIVPYIFKKGLARIITKLPVKIVVIIVSVALFGVNVWGFTQLEQYFNPNWFIPDDSYASEYLDAQDKYFSEMGDTGFVYCGQMSYFTLNNEFDKLDNLMKSSEYITNGTTDSWFEALTDWLSVTTDSSVTVMVDNASYPTSEENFFNLTHKLTTEVATRTRSNIIFASSSDHTIKASRFQFDHIKMDDAQKQIDAMDDTIDLITRAGLSSKDCFPYSFFYPVWETNKVIKEELFRNLALAMLCVFIVGLILIANFVTTLVVFLGVIFTLVDVAGTMHFWDLTIDTVTSVVLILSIGLAVDYSAHIGHMFMRVKGTRKERVKETIREIGPPVFFGGFSTLLAFLLLAASNSYVFRTFFKVNFLVVIYGLFHGLIFVPVMLSLFGPAPYPNATLVYKNHKKDNQVGNGSVENPAFKADKTKRSEMTNLSNLPPLSKPEGQTNHGYVGQVEPNASSSFGERQPSGRTSYEESPPSQQSLPPLEQKPSSQYGESAPSDPGPPANDNPNITVFRL